MEGKLKNVFSRISEDISTISGSSVDMNELIEKTQRESSLMRQTKFKKMGKLAKLMIIVVVMAVLAGAAVFCIKFFNRSIQCA